MKKIFFVIAAAAMMLVGCTKELEQRIDSLDQRVSALEEAVKALNTDVDAIQTVLNALEAKVYVSAVNQVAGGYEIVFTNGTKATIKDGAKGDKGDKGETGATGATGAAGAAGAPGKDGQTPVIGVTTVDGVLVWTVNGQPLKDAQGNNVPATGATGAQGPQGPQGPQGEQGATGATGPQGPQGPQGEQGVAGVTPEFKLENGKLYYSVDGKTTWLELGNVTGANGADGADGKDANAWFTLTQDANTVTLTLTDGSGTIVLPKYNAFDIQFDSLKVSAIVNTTVKVAYTISGEDPAVVRAYASDGVTVKVTQPAKDTKKGALEVSVAADAKLASAWIDVFAINNKTGEIKARSLSFVNGVLTVAKALEVPAVGGNVTVGVTTDQVYTVKAATLPAWLKYVETKALRTETLTFKAEANKTAEVRTGVIELVSGETVLATINVTQKPLATALTVSPLAFELPVGSEQKFNVTVTPSAADQKLVWTLPAGGELVMDGNFIKVNPEAIQKGYANIIAGKSYKVYATSASNPELKDSAVVKVTAVMVEEIDVPAPKEYVAAMVGQVIPLEYSVLPANASDKTVTFASSNEKVVKVDDKGVVTVVGRGEAKVTITSNDQFCTLAEDPKAYVAPSACVVFAVTDDQAPTSVAFPADSLNLPVNGKVLILPTVGPDTAVDTTVTYSFVGNNWGSDLYVDADTLKMVKKDYYGNANKVGKSFKVVASLNANPTVTDTVVVTVTAVNVTGVKVEPVTVKMGETDVKKLTLNPAILPANHDGGYLWGWAVKTGSDVVSVSNAGVLTLKKAGNAVVTVKLSDGYAAAGFKEIVAEIPVTVLNADGTPALESIKFAKDTVVVDVLSTEPVDLGLTYNPTAAKGEVTYAVKNLTNQWSGASWIKIADGKLTLDFSMYSSFAEAYQLSLKRSALGNYQVVASCGELKDTTVVAVTATQVKTVALGVSTMELSINDEYTMQYVLTPENATDKRVQWRSSDNKVVTVVDGVIKAVGAGTAKVYLTALDAFADKAPEAVCVVTVNKLPAASIAFAAADTTKTFVFGKDAAIQLAPVFKEGEDANVYDQTVKYEVVEGAIPTLVKVDPATHKLTVQQYNSTWVEGTDKDVNNTYKVRATLVSNPTKYAEFKVVVKLNAPTAVNFTSPLVGMQVGGVFTPTVSYTPADALGVDGEFTLATSDATVVAVEGTSLKALKAGKATVTIYAPQTYNYGDLKVQPLYPFGKPVSTTFEVEVAAPAGE